MTALLSDIQIHRHAPLKTWMGIGGKADRLARPASVTQVAACIQADADALVIGDGANLLVDDAGVGQLVLNLSAAEFSQIRIDKSSGAVRIGAGALLPRLLTACARAGLAGIEEFAGIPGSMGGIVKMNAGGALHQIADVVSRVHAVDRAGQLVVLERSEIDFGYRCSGLDQLVIVQVELALKPDDPAVIREQLLHAMERKKQTQPLADKSCGCVFKNPTLTSLIPGIGGAGMRVSAGLLIDRAGCKGLGVGSVQVSVQHANFFNTASGTTTEDVFRLIEQVQNRVEKRFGVELETELVIWKRKL